MCIRDSYKALSQIHDKLNPDGLLLIETWNCDSLAARVFGTNWHQYNPPSVLHWFSKLSLAEQLEHCDFEVVQTGRPVKWISLGNAAAALKKAVSDSKLLSTLCAPLGLMPEWLKVPYPMDDCFWIVARKKARVSTIDLAPKMAPVNSKQAQGELATAAV